MNKKFWINLPVKDVQKSKAFFTELGFLFNEQRSSKQSACMLLGEKNLVMMLFDEPTFKSFISRDIADTSVGTEVLLSIDADSKEEVDAIVVKAIAAGGTSTHQPTEMKSWLYGCIFTDLDGHRWNVLYMDMNQIPQ